MGRIIGFLILIIVDILFWVIAIIAWKSKKPVGFFAGINPPEVSDVKRYNRAVAKIWFYYAIMMILLGIPLLAGQNKALIVVSILGMMYLAISIAVMYLYVENKYKKK